MEGKSLLRPVSMMKIKAIVHQEYIDPVIHSLGEMGCISFIDMRNKLNKFLKPVEPPEVYRKSLDIQARLTELLRALNLQEVAMAEKVEMPKENLSELIVTYDENLKEIEKTYRKIYEDIAREILETTKGLEKEFTLTDEQKLKMQRDILSERLKTLVEDKTEELLRMLGVVKVINRMAHVWQFFGRTMDTYYFEAWVPEEKAEEVKDNIKTTSRGHCVVEAEKPNVDEEPPTLSKNPKLSEPYRRIVSSYGVPSYFEIDPTLIMTVLFPALFGLMFADVGDGIILAASALLMIKLRNRIKQSEGMIRTILNGAELYLLCGIFAALYGLVFGEFFGFHIQPLLGFTLEMLPGIGEIFSPLENPLKMFKLTLIVGTTVIALGLIINFVNKLIKRKYKEAFFESACWFWFYVSLMYLVLFGFKLNIDLWFQNINSVVFPLVILPIILMILGNGFLHGPIEGFSFTFEAVISSIGNTLSFARILALNLAHSIFRSVLLMAWYGMGGIMGPVIMAIGTIFLILMLEGLIVFIHTVRLNWVEWFSKFYKGEGIEYKPFTVKIE